MHTIKFFRFIGKELNCVGFFIEIKAKFYPFFLFESCSSLLREPKRPRLIFWTLLLSILRVTKFLPMPIAEHIYLWLIRQVTLIPFGELCCGSSCTGNSCTDTRSFHGCRCFVVTKVQRKGSWLEWKRITRIWKWKLHGQRALNWAKTSYCCIINLMEKIT